MRDLRNPLGTIVMGAHHIRRANLGERPTRSAARIITTAEHMARMLDQLIDVTRMRAEGELALSRRSVDLASLALRTTAQHATRAFVFGNQGDTTGRWDADRLGHVVTHVIGNAITHGSREDVITVEVDGRDPELVTLCVHNAGAIEPELLPAIFDPARRGIQLQQGRGLGLFITQQIVLAHGGEIGVTSAPGDGTLVRVVLPRGVVST